MVDATPAPPPPPFLPSALTPTARDQLTIFISVVSYRDPETLLTLQSIYLQAAVPHRVHAGIVWQYNPVDDVHLFTPSSSSSSSILWSNVRQLFLPHTSACGPMYARHLGATRLYHGQQLYMQIDSHMRLRKGWDQLLIDMLYSAAEIADKPIISSYPADYTETDSETDNSEWKEPVNVMCATHFDSQGMLRVSGKPCPSSLLSQPLPSLFIAAGFLFTSARILGECCTSDQFPFLFFGEEILLTLRCFTYGYHPFLPTTAVIRHKWTRGYRPTFRELRNEHTDRIEIESRQRLITAILAQGEKKNADSLHLFGSCASSSAFWTKVGIDYTQQSISEYAKRGGVDWAGVDHTNGDSQQQKQDKPMLSGALLQYALSFLPTEQR